MSTSFGCVTVVGAIAATMTLCTGEAAIAAAPIPCYAVTSGTTATDNVAKYGAVCDSGPVCFQSISQAMACAIYTMGSLQGSYANTAVTETLTVGTHTTPQTFNLTVDDGTGAAPTDDVFKFGTKNLNLYPTYGEMTGASPINKTCLGTLGGSGPGPSSCLIVTGPGLSSNTTLVTNENFNSFSGENISHVVVEHMTVKQYPETILNSQFVGTATTTLTEGSTTGTFYAVKIKSVVGSNHFIEGANHFAAISPLSNNGSYSCVGDSSCSAGVSLTILDGCSTQPTVVFKAATNGTLKAPISISNFGTCSSYPISSNPYSTSCNNCTSSGTATAYISYRPSPETINIAHINNDYALGTDEGAQHLFVYTNEAMPHRINSDPVSDVINTVNWGNVTVAGNSYYVPPSFSGGGTWTITLSDTYSPSTADPWLQEYFLCASCSPAPLIGLHHDSGNGVRFNSLSNSPANVDIVFNDMVWINSARNLIEGTLGLQILSNQILRDPTISPQMLFLASSGGFQIGQGGDQGICGTTIHSFNAQGTGDDAIAIFNDLGSDSGGTLNCTVFPQSSISGSSTITDSVKRAVNLANNPTITGIANGNSGPGQCPNYGNIYSTGPSSVLINGSAALSEGAVDPCKAASSNGTIPSSPGTVLNTWNWTGPGQ